jgi:hypothetical protein
MKAANKIVSSFLLGLFLVASFSGLFVVPEENKISGQKVFLLSSSSVDDVADHIIRTCLENEEIKLRLTDELVITSIGYLHSLRSKVELGTIRKAIELRFPPQKIFLRNRILLI